MASILETKIDYLKGVGERKSKVLKAEANIETYDDLLHYFPYRYIDRTKILPLPSLVKRLI